MSAVTPSASYSLTVRLSITNRPGMLGRVAMAIGEAGGDIGAVDLVESTRDRIVRDITINARDSNHGQQIVAPYSVRPLPGATVVTPLGWDELDEALDPRELTMRVVLERVAREGDLLARLLSTRQRLDSALERVS